MFSMSESIVYLWLVPVILQIVMPLGLFGCWLVGRTVFRLFGQPAAEVSTAGASA